LTSGAEEELRYQLFWDYRSLHPRPFLGSFLYGGCVDLLCVISILDSKHSIAPLSSSKRKDSTLFLALYRRLPIKTSLFLRQPKKILVIEHQNLLLFDRLLYTDF
jgi:hypothetical protein